MKWEATMIYLCLRCVQCQNPEPLGTLDGKMRIVRCRGTSKYVCTGGPFALIDVLSDIVSVSNRRDFSLELVRTLLILLWVHTASSTGTRSVHLAGVYLPFVVI